MRRRTFLSLLAAGPLAATLAPPARALESPLLSAWAEGADDARRYYAGDTGAGARLALPARGHAVIAHPQRPWAYACARRPGEYLIRFDRMTGRLLAQVEADEMTRYEGHAVVDIARRRLLTTESETEHGEGRIGLYDPETLDRIGEWSTHGIGPHELLFHSADVLAVANGGILTLPETGRIKRNLDAMEPSLVLLDARDGRKLAQYTLPDRHLSIRHLALAADGTLGAALQHEGNGGAPLLALLRDDDFRLAPTPPALAHGLKDYAASVAAHGDRFAVSCTRADRIAIWESSGRFCGDIAMPKPAGLAPHGSGWLASNEYGDLWDIDAGRLAVVARRRQTGRLWDNHLATV